MDKALEFQEMHCFLLLWGKTLKKYIIFLRFCAAFGFILKLTC
jgi:hypothetical protein